MLFNSFDFAIFLPIVFLSYWFLFAKKRKGQNLLLLIASYFFYGWWDWRFLGLILFSTIVDYCVGLGLGKAEKQTRRKFILLISILVNVGFLGYFKYFNFFLELPLGNYFCWCQFYPCYSRIYRNWKNIKT